MLTDAEKKEWMFKFRLLSPQELDAEISKLPQEKQGAVGAFLLALWVPVDQPDPEIATKNLKEAFKKAKALQSKNKPTINGNS